MGSEVQILEEVLTFIKNYFGKSDISGDSNMFEEIPLDSLGTFELLAFLDTKYGIKLPAEKLKVDIIGTPRKLSALIHAVIK